jgi:hypothetical protein
MTAADPVFFTKLMLCLANLVNNPYIEFEENPANGLVCDSGLQTKERTWSPHKALFYFVQDRKFTGFAASS